MADVFISYARQDAEWVAGLADALARSGYSIWWDRDVSGGARFSKVIEAELTVAKAVVVVWTAHAAQSHWVADEAAVARDSDRLVPVSRDGSMPPLGFRQFQVVDFDGEADFEGPSFARLKTALARHAAPAPPVEPAAPEASLAVLPFANISPDPEQEYFSDGLAEELMDQLAQLQGLRVTGRTSAFAFKGRAEDVRSIGQKLGVGHVLEGSVRKAGERLRIAVRLVKCSDGYRLWSQTYDRRLEDVFAIQEEVAHAVTEALGVTLGIGPQARDYGGTRSFEAFEHFLKGRFVPGEHIPRDKAETRPDHLRRAIGLDPAYAIAWAHLANLLGFIQTQLSAEEARALDAERDDAAARALALAPELPIALFAEGWRLSDQRRWLEADRCMRAIVRQTRVDEYTAGIVGAYFADVGRSRESLPLRERARDSDPLSLGWTAHVLGSCLAIGLWDRFDAEYLRSQELEGPRGLLEGLQLVRLVVTDAPATQIRSQVERLLEQPSTPSIMRSVAPVLESPQEALSILREYRPSQPSGLILAAELAALLGDVDLSLEMLRKLAPDARLVLFQQLFRPTFAKVRRDPRFKALMQDVGLAQFWRQSGNWPDLARPLGEDDFEFTG